MEITASSDAPLHERVVALEAELSPSERKVARFLADHPNEIPSLTAADLGQRTGTSDATVVRTVKALGYSGIPELKRVLLKAMTDRRDPARKLAQSIEHLGTDATIADQVLLAAGHLVQEARRLIDPETWRKAVDVIDGAATVVAYGIGEAGCVAQYFAIELSRCGVPARSRPFGPGQVIVGDNQFGELPAGGDRGDRRAHTARANEKDAHVVDTNAL